MDIQASLDQLGALLRDIAPMLMKYKNELIKQGFTEDQAFILVRDYHMQLFIPKK